MTAEQLIFNILSLTKHDSEIEFLQSEEGKEYLDDLVQEVKKHTIFHVQKALKQAAYNAKVRITENIELANITQHYQIRHGKYVICDKESILNAYPIENIK